MVDPSDEILMTRYAHDGDRAAFEQLFRRYASRLAALFRRTGSDDQTVNDLVQQTFLQLHNARLDFDASRKLRPWLYAIALNVGRRSRATFLRRRETAIFEDDRLIVAPDASTASDRAVQRAIARLQDDQREVIVLHWYDGLSFPEIAEIVDASVSAVKVRAHRGYERLRDLLGRDL